MKVLLYILGMCSVLVILWVLLRAKYNKRKIVRQFNLLQSLWDGSIHTDENSEIPIYCFAYNDVKFVCSIYERSARPIGQLILDYLLKSYKDDNPLQNERRWCSPGVFTECAAAVPLDREHHFYLLHTNDGWRESGESSAIGLQLLNDGGEAILCTLAAQFPHSKVDCSYDGLFFSLRLNRWTEELAHFALLRDACFELRLLALEQLREQ